MKLKQTKKLLVVTGDKGKCNRDCRVFGNHLSLSRQCHVAIVRDHIDFVSV